MSRSPYCDKKSPCMGCGDCCSLLVCGYAMQQRGFDKSNAGPCEYLREHPNNPGHYDCGLYVDLMKSGKKVRASIMARDLHFGQGCTNPINSRRKALL